jgi:subtilisin family serine protease
LIPSSFELPNLLVVGAVNKYGELTTFTGDKSNADIYANGVDVETRIPGGKTMKMSGCSFAVPAATNLAAKIIALNNKLHPQQVIDLIIKGASISPTDSILLINPLKTVAIVENAD